MKIPQKILIAFLCLIFFPLYNSYHNIADATELSWADPGTGFNFFRGDGLYNCSVGLPAIDDHGGKYFLTAGHCFRSEDGVKHFSRNDTTNQGIWIYSVDDKTDPVGYEYAYNTPTNDTMVDVSLIKMLPGKKLHGANFTHFPMIPIISHVGDKACLAGRRWNTVRCGTISHLSQTIKYIHYQYSITHITDASYCGLPGDSGGAVFNENGVLGINSGGAVGNNINAPGKCFSEFVDINDALLFLRKIVPSLRLAGENAPIVALSKKEH